MLDIDLRLIVAQVITFLIGLYLLWRIAYKPLGAIVAQRADRIKKDLEAAAEARRKMETARQQYEAEIAQLEQKAAVMINAAMRAGQKAQAEIVSAARAQGEDIIQRAEERIAIEKDKAIKEIRQEVVDISLLAAQRIIGVAVDDNLQQRLVDDVFSQLEGRKS